MPLKRCGVLEKLPALFAGGIVVSAGPVRFNENGDNANASTAVIQIPKNKPLVVWPKEAAHVGDNPVDDVVGAQGAGMRAIHFSPAGGASPSERADAVIPYLGQLPELLRTL